MKNLQYTLLIFLIAFNLRVGISSVPPLLELIKSDLSLSNFQASLLTSLPVLFMGIMAFFVSYFQNRLGRNKSISVLLFLLSVTTLSRFILTSYVLLLVSALLIGFSIAIIGPLLSGFIKSQFPNHVGLFIGVYSLSMGLGSVIVSGASLPIATSQGGSWNFSLGIWGILSVIALLFWLILAPKESRRELSNKIKMPFNNLLVWKMVLFFGVQSGIFYSIATWLPVYFLNKNQTAEESIFYLTTFTAIQMTASFLIPILIDKIGTIKIWILVCALSMITGIFLLSLTNQYITSIALLAVATGGFFPLAMLLPIEMNNLPNEASVWVAMTQGFGYIIGGIIPMMIGVIIDITKNYNSFPIAISLLTLILLTINFSKSQVEGNSINE